MSHPFVKDERVEDELNFALSAFIFAVSRRFVSLKILIQFFFYDAKQPASLCNIFLLSDISDNAPELSGDDD